MKAIIVLVVCFFLSSVQGNFITLLIPNLKTKACFTLGVIARREHLP